MNKEDLEHAIDSAFQGIILEGGVSLNQAQINDYWERGAAGKKLTQDDWDELARNEVKHDWRLIPMYVVHADWSFAHLDAKGYRYYVPAFMRAVLENYESTPSARDLIRSMRPRKAQLWNHYMRRYSLLDNQQRVAIAVFLRELPRIVELDEEDQENAAEAFANYWSVHLD